MRRLKGLIAFVSSHTDCGDRKDTNDDSILTMRRMTGGHLVCLYIVADGCGGMSGGNRTSRIITEKFCEWMEFCIDKNFFDTNFTDSDINEILDNEIDVINEYVFRDGIENDLKTASTMSLLFTVDDRYYIKHTGDSRIYLIKRFMRQLTQDQTAVADMVRNGTITAKEAKNHKKRHVLSMCMGYYKKVRIFSTQGKIKNNDTFLICSDGLYNFVKKRKIKKNAKKRDFVNNAKRLRDEIPEGCASDNVSAVLVKYKIR